MTGPYRALPDVAKVLYVPRSFNEQCAFCGALPSDYTGLKIRACLGWFCREAADHMHARCRGCGARYVMKTWEDSK